MSDVITVVLKLSKRHINRNTPASRSSHEADTKCRIDLPACLNPNSFSAASRNTTTLQTDHPTYVFRGGGIMTQLIKVDSYGLSNIYEAFFKNLFAEAKRQKVVSSGPMNYKLLTPPWVNGTVNFEYGGVWAHLLRWGANFMSIDENDGVAIRNSLNEKPYIESTMRSFKLPL